MILHLFGLLVDPTDVFTSEKHRQFSNGFVWLITIIVGSVTPISFIIIHGLLFTWIFSMYFDISKILEWTNTTTWNNIGIYCIMLWFTIEIIFYYYCLYLKNKFKPYISFPGLKTKHDKMYYLGRYLQQCPDPWSTLTRWFPNHKPNDIGIECMEEWLAWAYLSKNCKDMTIHEHEELNGMMNEIIQKCPRISQPSKNIPLNFMQLHFDKLIVQHKPFIAMVIIYIMQVSGLMILSWIGFEHHSLSGNTPLSYFSYEPKRKNISHETSSNQRGRPIFLVHGIGIGIAMYMNLVKTIIKNNPDTPIYILDIPHISLKIVDHVPNMEETLDAIDEIYTNHKLKDCSWLAHSYGTIITTWVLRERPKYVSNLTFIDPVCFALWEPDLIYNFLYRKPPGPIHRLCQFFVAQDLLVSYTLFRNFWWVQNILFPEHIQCPAKIYLSSHDFIIDSSRIYTYLINNQYTQHHGHVHGQENNIEQYKVISMKNLSHGSFLNSSKYMDEITQNL